MLKNDMPKIGMDVTFVEGDDLDGIKKALKANTKLVWFEPCTNPTVNLVDVEVIANIVHEYNKDIVMAVDNTFLTPYALVSKIRIKTN